MDCRWCDPAAPIRERTVLVGRAPGRPVRMYIDKEPHEGEQVVIQRDDGRFRLLAPHERAHAVKPTFRIHSRRNCAPSSTAGRPTAGRAGGGRRPTSDEAEPADQ